MDDPPWGATRARLVVEARELDDETAKVRLVEDEHVVEQLTPQGAPKRSANAFMSGARIAVRTTRVSTAASVRTKLAPNFESRSQTSTCGASPSKVALRACCAHQGSVGV